MNRIAEMVQSLGDDIRRTLHSATLHLQASQGQFLFASIERNQRNKEQRAVMCGCIDLILHRLRWETSGWRGWEMKSGIGSFLNGSNYRLSATLRQHTGLDLALVDACSCYTSSTSRHHKDRATQRLQHDYDSCLTTCPCILFERDLSIQKLVADDQVLEGLTRPGHSPYSSFANGRCIA